MATYDFLADPRTLSLEERHRAKRRYAREQAAWLGRLGVLAEAPRPDDDFPAFLLATAPCPGLARRPGRAVSRQDMPPAVADELDWFVRAFADYLRTDEGEDAFAESRRRTG